MDDVKKKRAGKARVLTRRTKELLNSTKLKLHEVEIVDKINNLKYAISELGTIQDDVMSLLEEQYDGDAGDEKDKNIKEEEEWYDAYDKQTSLAIKEARQYIDEANKNVQASTKVSAKVKKLEVPTFKSDPKEYHKWKETFLRFTNNFEDSSRYDYLYNYTEGEAHRYVSNRRGFADAIQILDEKFGNVHDIMGILIDEIKSLSVVNKNDVNGFENLSLKVNDFKDRLVLMGKDSEAENSYILREIERKLCTDDLQKWLESQGDQVDNRTVNSLLKWLEKQSRLRKICQRNTGDVAWVNHVRVPSAISEMNVSAVSQTQGPKRCYLPVVRMNIVNGDAAATAKAVVFLGPSWDTSATARFFRNRVPPDHG